MQIATVDEVEYKVFEEQNRIERLINGCTLVIIFHHALIGNDGWSIFTLDKDGCTPIDKRNPNYNKNSSVEEYVKNQRPPIFYKVPHWEILKSINHFWKIFKKKTN